MKREWRIVPLMIAGLLLGGLLAPGIGAMSAAFPVGGSLAGLLMGLT